MADTPKLEDIANQASNEPAKKEEKPRTNLESFIDESLHFAGSALKLGAGIAIPYSFAQYVPTFARDTAILSGAQVASDMTIAYKRGKKYTAGSFLESTVLGTATTPVIETMFRVANSVPTDTIAGYFAKGAVWGGLMYPAFVAAYQPFAYLIRNRTFKGMGKYIKENYWPTLKSAWTKLLPLSLLNIFFAPSWLQIPISAGLSYLFDLFGAPQKGEIPEDQKRDKTPYLVAASSALTKGARNIFYGVPNAVYSIGGAIGSYLTPKPRASPGPATAPVT